MRLPTFNTGRSDPCNNSYALDGEILAEIDRCENDLMPAVQTLYQEKTDSAARSAQECLNAVWDLIFELPFYRDLSLDVKASRTLFPTLLTNRAKWAEVLDVNAEGRRMFEDLFSALKYFTESLRNFRGQVGRMLELYFEPLPQLREIFPPDQRVQHLLL